MCIRTCCHRCNRRRRGRSVICLSASRHLQFSIAGLLPLYAPHTLIVLSSLPVTRVCPVGLMATLSTGFSWPVRVRTSLPVDNSHTLIVLSQLPLTRVCPSELTATLRTLMARARAIRSRWRTPSSATLLTASASPVRVRTSLPVDNSHTLIVLSLLPLTRVCPPGLMATLTTASVWPVRVGSNISCSTGRCSKTVAFVFGC